MRFRYRRVLWMVWLAWLLTLDPGLAGAAIQIFEHQDRPVLGERATVKAPAVTALDFTLVGQASEGSLIEIAVGKGGLTVDYNPAPAQDLTLTVYRVAAVGSADKGRFLDPLIPLKPGASVDSDGTPSCFYVKLTAGKNAVAGKGEHSILFKAGSEQVTLKIAYTVLPFVIQDESFPTVQATIRPMFGTYPRTLTRDERLQVLKNIAALMARSYHVRSFAGFGGTGKADLTIDWDKDQGVYAEMARYCLDELGAERLRIPAQHLFSKHHPLSSFYPNPTEEIVYADLMRYRKRIETLVTNPKWKGRLSMRLWDEPRPLDDADVVMTYKAARRAFPELSLELTAQPDDRLGDLIDVWAVHPRLFNETAAKRQQLKGAKIWIYCNKAARIEEQLKQMRIIGWMLYRHGLDGYLFYSINYWNVEPWAQSDRWWAGTFVYPDYAGTGVFPSLKLEYFRAGLEDAAIMRQLEAVSQQRNDAKTREVLTQLRTGYPMAELNYAAPDPRIHRKTLMEHIAATFKQ